MAKAKRLPSGSYRAQVFDYTDDTGKRHYKSFTADTKKEAEYMAAEFALDKKKAATGTSISFGSAVEKYIKDKEAVLSPATIRGYKTIITTLEREFTDFQKLPIDQITQSDIQQLINRDSMKRTPKTIRNHHGLISAVLAVYRPDFALNTTLPQKSTSRTLYSI